MTVATAAVVGPEPDLIARREGSVGVIRLNRPLPAFPARLLGTSVQPRQVAVRMNRLLRELLRFGGPGAAWSPCGAAVDPFPNAAAPRAGATRP